MRISDKKDNDRIMPASTSSASHNLDPLLSKTATAGTNYGAAAVEDRKNQPHRQHGKPFQNAAFGDHGGASTTTNTATMSVDNKNNASEQEGKNGPIRFLYYIVYALVNVIISAPGLYGYAAVIFNHPVYETHMNALSKLVIFSSLIHQLGFTIFSTLDFSIGTVQDAGLIFLSAMANTIANSMLEDGHTTQEIVTTTLVLLSAGTALLGVCLIVVGRCGLADAVSYLPMPVVGGYLAYIGYFCCQAGVALCISTPLITLSDWSHMLDPQNLLLAAPGLGAGLILTLSSRNISNDAALPLIMVAIPAAFYLILFITGQTLEDARETGWVGQVAPPVPVSDLFGLVDFGLVKWSVWTEIFSTWCGMLFVVAFASCLDVAAIAIDMGEALDTNKELTTVGICNLMSGLTLGFTGSYIFSQTIFTYRTGVHSRWIGVLIMFVFLYIVVSEVNMLQIAPLFFLGSTLIFIGYDLLFEWLWEIRHQVFITEYAIVILTFLAIQLVGIDAGIVVGVLVAIVDHVVLTAASSTITKIQKRSRAIWTPDENKILHNYAYNIATGPKIVTLEMTGTIFFGSALQILNRIIDETNLKYDSGDVADGLKSPRTPHTPSLMNLKRRMPVDERQLIIRPAGRPPKYLVLDLLYVTMVDASATRGCFLQLVKLCAKEGTVVCVSGVTPRIEWMFRTHGVAYKTAEKGAAISARLQSETDRREEHVSCENALLFVSVQDALEFCENAILHEYKQKRQMPIIPKLVGPQHQSFTSVVAKILKSSSDEKVILARLAEAQRYHDEIEFSSGDVIFQKDTHSDSFYIVLQGAVANTSGSARAVGRLQQKVFSGAGKVRSQSNLLDPLFLEQSDGKATSHVAAMIWGVGSIVGYLDYLLDRPRVHRLTATKNGTRVAKITNSHMNLLNVEDAELYSLIQKVLLHASTSDLADRKSVV